MVFVRGQIEDETIALADFRHDDRAARNHAVDRFERIVAFFAVSTQREQRSHEHFFVTRVERSGAGRCGDFVGAFLQGGGFGYGRREVERYAMAGFREVVRAVVDGRFHVVKVHDAVVGCRAAVILGESADER